MVAFVVAVFLPVGGVHGLLVTDQLEPAVSAERLSKIVLGAVQKDAQLRRIVPTCRQNEPAELRGAQLAQAVILLAEARFELVHARRALQVSLQGEQPAVIGTL